MALTAYAQALHNNLSLKITAFIIGYSMWAALSNIHATRITYHVPVTFYNVPENCQLTGPEACEITLSGKRAQLRTLAQESLALHVDGNTLVQGDNYIVPSSTSLFLPEDIEVVHYQPTHLIVRVQQNNISHEQETVTST